MSVKFDMLRPRISIFFLFLLVIGYPAFAGNPLYVNPDSSPLIWDTTAPIRYRVDAQGLGALTCEQSVTLVQQALQVWESVPDTSLQFEYAGSTQEAVTLDNWEQIMGRYIYAQGERSEFVELSDAQEEEILVFGFDNTGEILTTVGSEGAAGIHSLTGVSGNYAEPGSITSAFILLNGTYYDGVGDVFSDLELNDVFAILVHEIGHALGLEHSLANAALYEEILNGDRPLSDARYLPTLFPRFIRGTGALISTLNPDDKTTLQQLYGTQVSFSGEIKKSDGSPAGAVVVTARNTTATLCRVYSQVTGLWCGTRNSSSDGSGATLFNAPYCFNESEQGTFSVAIDPSATYAVSAEDIPELFEDSITRLLGQVDHSFSEAEFFNANDAASEDQFSLDTIEVDIADVSDLDVILAISASTDPAVTMFPISYFEDEELFLQDEDALCPTTAEIDIASELSTIAPLPDLSSGGCSLTRSAATPCHSFVFWVLLAFGLLATRLRYVLYGQNSVLSLHNSLTPNF